MSDGYVINEDRAREEIKALSDNARMSLVSPIVGEMTIIANLESFERRMKEVVNLRKRLKEYGV